MPQRAAVPGPLLRDPEGGRGRGPAERPAQGAGGRLPPAGLGREGVLLLRGHSGAPHGRRGLGRVQRGRGLRLLLPGHRRPPGRAPDRRCREPRSCAERAVGDVRLRHPGGHRLGGDPLHVRDHGPTQGRRALARQPGAQRTDVQPAVRRRGPRRTPGHAPAVPLVRFHRPDERRLRGGSDPGPAPAVRRRPGARPPGARAGHVLRRRPDDVLGTARCPRRQRRRGPDRSEPPGGRVRWCQPPGGDHQGVQGPVPRADPGGLRPLRDLAPGHLRRRGARAAAGLDRCPDLGCRVQARGRGLAHRRGRGRGRRDRDQGPQRHDGLLQPARGHCRGDARRVVPDR